VQIGGVDVDPPLVLAPMEGVTDLAFRRLIHRVGGCGLQITEFVPAHALCTRAKWIRRMLRFDEDQRPTGIQIYGREPSQMAEAASMVQDLGADLVDLNMGCPSRKVCAHSGGSALMREPGLVREIVAAVRRRVSIPVTAKMRSGWDASSRNAPEIARICEEEGADAVAVHWRTRVDQYGGDRELGTIARVVDTVAIPVLANGDVVDVTSAVDTLAATRCAGLMIGRGAIADPWLFLKIEAALRGGHRPAPTRGERRDLLLGHLDGLVDVFESERGALGRFKHFVSYFTWEDGEGFRRSLLRSHTAAEVRDRIAAHFDPR